MANDSLERLRGKFIVLDGVDGAGKGVQMARLREALDAHTPRIEVVETRDPGGTEIGDRIRHVLFDYDLAKMDIGCETMLFMASRAQLKRDVIDPALAAGRTCLCDRYVSATCAYQGAAGYDPQRVLELARLAIGDTWPDVTILIDVPIEVGSERTGRAPSAGRKRRDPAGHKGRDVEGQVRLFHDTHLDAMEARPEEFHRRVRELFLEVPTYYPAPIVVVDGQGTADEVHERVRKAVVDAIR